MTVSQVKPGASDTMTVQAPSKCTSLNTLKLQNYHSRMRTTHSFGVNSYLRAAVPLLLKWCKKLNSVMHKLWIFVVILTVKTGAGAGDFLDQEPITGLRQA